METRPGLATRAFLGCRPERYPKKQVEMQVEVAVRESSNPRTTVLEELRGLPPLDRKTAELLHLGEPYKSDPRHLAMLAQGEPVFLARLLVRANSARFADKHKVHSAFEAVTRLGTTQSYAELVTEALANALELPSALKIQRNVVSTVAVKLTLIVRRLASNARLDDDQTALLMQAALFDPLGAHAWMWTRAEGWEDVALELGRAASELAAPADRYQAPLAGYWSYGTQLVHAWEGDERVGEIVEYADGRPRQCQLTQLLCLAHELLYRSMLPDKGQGRETTERQLPVCLQPLEAQLPKFQRLCAGV